MYTGVPENLTVFWNEITFQGRVEKFINTDRYIPMSTELQTALCMMTVSMEKHHIAGKLIFKFQKLLDVFGASV
jgi:hypothetical protein